MRYTVCKSFEIESGHMLSKHPGRCRFPHGHSRRVDVVVSSERLDPNDMVCDFKALKLAVADLMDRLDHAMVINAADPALPALRDAAGRGASADDAAVRIIPLEGVDPTTEVLARLIFDHLAARMAAGATMADDEGGRYRLPDDLRLERVRVTETSTSWAEYGR